MERRNEPAHNYVAARPGLSGSNVATIQASTLDSLKQFLISKFGYDPGSYENFYLKTYNDKLLFRLDYNIARHHKLNISYNYLKSWKDIVTSTSNSANNTRYANQNTLWFSNNGYRINNNINSVVAELNSIFGTSLSNNLIVGYSGFRDFRSSPSTPFPMVDILNHGITMTSFGYEQYTPNNKLNTDVIQVSDNLTIYKGAHTLTLGGSYEHYHFENGFTPQFYGYFKYNSLSDFYNDVNNQSASPSNYQLTYSAVAGVPVPLAKISVAQIGFYGQDEWKVIPTLKVTLGIRADLPSYPASLPKNPVLDNLSFLNSDEQSVKIDVSKLPDIKPLWSPRVGFNWNVFGNKTTQVRGGTGIFTGHIPFVWISNQASNNGILFGNINVSNASASSYHFSPDVTKYIPTNPTLPATVLINATASNFKFPQVLRNSLAVDQKLPFGAIGTLEAIYTKDINAVIHKDYNLIAPAGTISDGRDTFNIIANNRRINKNITSAYVLENTNQGYSYFLTAQLQKTFNIGLYAMVAFTYGQTKDLSANPGSIASSAFTGNPVQSNPNKPELSYSTYDQPYKLIALLTYRKEYLGHFASALSLIYNGVQGGGGSSNERPSDGRFSYTYGGDLNRDGISGNDLIYIPKNQSDINLVRDHTDANDTRTPDEIWAQLNAYIEQDKYLRKHRGQIMQRNGAVTPWNSQVDLKFVQDVFMDFGKKRNTIEFSLDVINFSNLLNHDWGVKKTMNRRALLNFEDFKGPNGTPEFSFPYFDSSKKLPLTSSFGNDVSIASRWQLQFGLRYIF